MGDSGETEKKLTREERNLNGKNSTVHLDVFSIGICFIWLPLGKLMNVESKGGDSERDS